MAWLAPYRDTDGFYTYTLPDGTNGSTAAIVRYVSSSLGDNAWDGTKPVFVSGTIGPKKTICDTRKFTVTAANATQGSLYELITAYTFTVSGVTVTPTAGATYTNNGLTFTVTSASITAGSGTVTCTNAAGGLSEASGTLTKSGGTGDATITFSAVSRTSKHFTTSFTIAGATTLQAFPYSGEAAPAASGVLTKTAGTGDALITYSSVASLEFGGFHLIVNATSNLGHWLLFRRGDTFNEQRFEQDVAGNFLLKGKSADEPLIIGCYDEDHLDAGGIAIPNPAASVRSRPLFVNDNIDGAGSHGMRTFGSGQDWAVRAPNYTVWLGLEGDGPGGGSGFIWNANPTNWYRIEDCLAYDYGYGFNTGAQVHIFRSFAKENLGQGIDWGTYPPAVYGYMDENGNHGTGSYSSVVEECFVDNNPGSANGFIHNFYTNGFSIPVGEEAGPNLVHGTLCSRDLSSTQFRAGGVWNNNASVGNAFSLVWGMTSNTVGQIKNSSFIHGINTTVGTSQAISTMTGSQYISDAYNYGTTLIDTNIFAHNEDAASDVVLIRDGQRGLVYSNNLFYKVGTVGVTDAVAIESTGNVAAYDTITPGSGYTDRTLAITNITWSTTAGAPNIIRVTHDQTGWPWATGIHTREGYVYIDGIAGTLGTALNGRVYRVNIGQGPSGETWISPANVDGHPDLTGLSYSSGGTMYLPYLGREFGGGNSNLKADVIVANGGIVDIRFGTDADNANDTVPFAQRGSGYTDFESITLQGTVGATGGDGSDIGTIPGGSNFSVTVRIANPTDGGGNVIDIDGTGDINAGSGTTYPYPERTAATYYNEIILGAGVGAGAGGYTYNDYCDACMAMSRQSWSDLLMAESLNDYLRQGMGLAMIGSAYADSVSSISITPSTLPGGTVNVSYSQALTASGGTAPYTYSVITGSLPTGLSLDANTGIISGIPTVAATYAFTVQATDNASATGSQAYSVTIAAAVPSTGGGTGKGRGKKKNILGRMIDYLKQKMNSLLGRSSS